MSGFGHGSVGTREQAFTHLLPLRAKSYPTHELLELANSIKSEPDTVKDGPDPEENLLLPGVNIAKTLLAKYCLTLKSDKNQSIWSVSDFLQQFWH